MTIYLGGDHAGFDLKEQLEAWLLELEYPVKDLGNTEFDPKDDYPDFGHAVAEAVAHDVESCGILLCGNAEGVCIVANKTDGIRAGIGFSVEAVRSARTEDNINILCLPARLTDMKINEAKIIVGAFLSTAFEGADRRVRRLNKIEDIEKDN
ncbi:TPA: ribose-5-phosphate isomerase [Candidatus Uhrbacteria bacterium]|nr:ribose-5-phosphate isomerase [Candidatus Uhrbacteria bacterium]